MSFLFGHPPKGIRIRVGNCSTSEVAALVRAHRDEIGRSLADEEAGFLALG